MPDSRVSPSHDPSDLEADAVALNRLRPVRHASSSSIERLCQEVGILMNTFEHPVVLADAMTPDCPIVGASESFAKLSGRTREDILGRRCSFLLEEAPECFASRSGQKNLRSMMRMCRLVGLSSMGCASCAQTSRAHNGDIIVNSFTIGLVTLQGQPFVIGTLCAFPEDATKGQLSKIQREQRSLIAQIRIMLKKRMKASSNIDTLVKPEDNFVQTRVKRSGECVDAPAFCSDALTERVILLNESCTVMRREPVEIPNGCVVVSQEALSRTPQGLFFAVRLEGVLQVGWKDSWPVLGVTQLSPNQMTAQGYPLRGEWCGKSVCVGGDYQAWCRDKAEHKFLDKEVQAFDGPRPRWQGRTGTPWELDEGDVMGMLYTPEGEVHLMLNYQTVLSIDTGKPLQEGNYHALVDCRGQAYELTLLPHDVPLLGTGHELSSQPLVARKVAALATQAAASRAVESCTRAVALADPSQPNVPLLSVSPAFEEMINCKCDSVVGEDLNKLISRTCDLNSQQQRELRHCLQTGAPFSCLLHKRGGESGKPILTLVDFRGVCIAKDLVNKEDMWYVIGIQSDVTNLIQEQGETQADIQEMHTKELEAVAQAFRRELKAEFADRAVPSQTFMVEEDSSGQTFVSVPAMTGIQLGPKPPQQPMTALLPEPSWIPSSNAGDDNVEDVHVDKRPKTNLSALSKLASKPSWSVLETASILQQYKQYVPMLSAFTLGVASVMVFQRSCQRQ